MIKDSIDFDNAINNIITKTKTNIILQNNILESEKLNMTFTEIEKSLNTLYEKTRFIEDAIEYATTFLNTKVKEFNDEMYSVMKEIEEDVDSSKKLAYITYNVPLKANNISIKDKNNNNLQPLILKDKVLTLGNKIDNSTKKEKKEEDIIDVFAEPVSAPKVAEPKAQEAEISAEMEALANEYFEADEQ